jgi:hypothetical protein
MKLARRHFLHLTAGLLRSPVHRSSRGLKRHLRLPHLLQPANCASLLLRPILFW